MEKKRSVGITIFAWLIIVLGIIFFLSSLDFKTHMKIYQSFPKNLNVGLIVYGILSSLISIIAGIGLLQLKEVMRKVVVGINLLDVLISIPVLFFSINSLKQFAYNEAVKQVAETNSQVNVDILANISFYFIISFGIFFIVLSLLVIYFFTRPKVKEMFR